MTDLESSATDAANQTGNEVSPLIEVFAAGCKKQRTIGLELEVIGYALPDWTRLTPEQVEKVMQGFAARGLGVKVEEDFIVEVELGIGRVTLEPGGQVEFSGNPSSRLSQLDEELATFLTQLGQIADQHHFAFLSCGFDPLCSLAEQHWIPRRRYDIMRPYLRNRGSLAESMMTQTTAIQCTVDYDSIENLVKKFLLGNRLAPVIAAMCANSPFSDARLNGYASYRNQVWLQTDPDRCGIPQVASENLTEIEPILHYILDLPMLFEMRDGEYRAAGSKTFRQHIRQRPGREVSQSDLALHLTSIFTDARLKPQVELRSPDSVREYPLAVMALWLGLVYDDQALDEALRLAPRLSPGECETLQTEVARHGLRAKTTKVNIGGLAEEIIRIACRGLRSVAPEDSRYLSVLEERVSEGMTPADILIRNYKGSWNQEMDPVLEALRVA